MTPKKPASWASSHARAHAGTRVLQRDPPGTPLPAWARAWLLAQLAGFFGVTGFVVLRYTQLLAEAAGGFG